jgi:cell division protein FtsB
VFKSNEMLSDDMVNYLRLTILDQQSIRILFDALRQYYTEKNLNPILDLLEASLLNAVSQLEVFRKLLEEKEIRDEVVTQIHDETHKIGKEIKEFKDKGVHEIIKEYLRGSK